MARAKATIDHQEIRNWVEKVGGCPAHVIDSGDGNDPGILRIDFTGYGGQETLEPIDWDTWLHWFDENDLAFLYQDAENSRFNKLVSRASTDLDASERERSDKTSSGVNPIKLLERQHREVEAAFEDFFEVSGKKQRRELFEKIANRLAAHTAIEENYFYPAVFDEDTEEELREAVEEHLAVKRLINDLLDMEPDDEQFDAKMRLMQELVEHHVEEEEKELFKIVRQKDVSEMSELGSQMEEEFNELLEQTPSERVRGEIEHAATL